MTPTTSRRRPRQTSTTTPIRNLQNRGHEQAPLGESAPPAGTSQRDPPAAPKPRPRRGASKRSAQEPPHREAPSALPEDLPPPLSSRPGPGSQVMARQASFSATWHHAVVSEVHNTNGRTHVSVVWDDGTITRAIPISRVRASRDSLTSPTPPGPQSVGPFAHLCQGARVMAKQTRYSPWCPATVSKRCVYNGRLTLTVKWEDAPEGPFTAGISTSRVKLPSATALRPPASPVFAMRIHPPQGEQNRSRPPGQRLDNRFWDPTSKPRCTPSSPLSHEK